MRLINFDPAIHNPKRVPLYTSDGFRVRVLRTARWIDRNYYACLITVKDGSEMEPENRSMSSTWLEQLNLPMK